MKCTVLILVTLLADNCVAKFKTFWVFYILLYNVTNHNRKCIVCLDFHYLKFTILISALSAYYSLIPRDPWPWLISPTSSGRVSKLLLLQGSKDREDKKKKQCYCRTSNNNNGAIQIKYRLECVH